jgi:hypothetical protein
MERLLIIRPFIFFLLLFIVFVSPSHGQKQIENYLLTNGLISTGQLKKYQEKIKADDQYVRIMLRLMKKEKEGQEYIKKMEDDYKKELSKRERNKDTLLLLKEILEVSQKKISISDLDSCKISPNPGFVSFIRKLASKKLITQKNVDQLLKNLNNGYLYDSTRIVENAIGFREKIISTSSSKLVDLADLFKKIGVMSEEKYDKLFRQSFPDSITPIQYIVSNCERVLFLKEQSFFLKGKDDFDSRILELSHLTGIEVSNAELRLITLRSDSENYRAIPVIELNHQGKNFPYYCYEVMTTEVKKDIYTLVGHDYYRIFNRILAYQRSPFRVYEIEENNPPGYIYQPWSGFIMLTKAQSDEIYRNENVKIDFEDTNDPLSDDNIIRAINLYKKIGLLNGVSQNYIDSILNDIKANPVYRYNELLGRFPAISLVIDDRIPVSQQEMVILIKRMAEISNYAFNPQNIRFKKDGYGMNLILFELKNMTYQENADLDKDPWRIINNAVFKELGANQFQVLRFEQYKVTYVYLSSEQMKTLEKEKVIGDY